MRKAVLILAALAALALSAVAEAAVTEPSPSVICANCDGGFPGWTGCTQETQSHSASVPLIASVNHFLVVSYCKFNGTITSISIAAHGCDAGGLITCSVGPAWQTGGGVGTGFATFEAHANWVLMLPPFYNNHDTLNITIPVG